MNSSPCATPTSTAALLSYWLRELGADEESDLEEHLFGCAECSAQLSDLVQLSDGIRYAARAGTLLTVLPAPFVERLKGVGVRLRRYDLQPGGSVLCTITPDDDAVVSYLHAPLQGVERLDLLVHDSVTNAHSRLEDIAFDPAASEVVLVPSVVELRRMPKTTQTMQLVAVAGKEDRQIAEYTFNHTPS